jgi:hypothetical protein
VDKETLSAARQLLQEARRLKFFDGLSHNSREEDEREYWAYHAQREALKKKFAAEIDSTEVGRLFPAEYLAELATLDWQFRGTLWRRNSYAIHEFRHPPSDEGSYST